MMSDCRLDEQNTSDESLYLVKVEYSHLSPFLIVAFPIRIHVMRFMQLGLAPRPPMVCFHAHLVNDS